MNCCGHCSANQNTTNNNIYHLLDIKWTPSYCTLKYIIFPSTLWKVYLYYFHFTKESQKRNQRLHLYSVVHIYWVVTQAFGSKWSDSKIWGLTNLPAEKTNLGWYGEGRSWNGNYKGVTLIHRGSCVSGTLYYQCSFSLEMGFQLGIQITYHTEPVQVLWSSDVCADIYQILLLIYSEYT